MKNTGLEKILGRIEDLDSVNLGILVQRLARERVRAVEHEDLVGDPRAEVLPRKRAHTVETPHE